MNKAPAVTYLVGPSFFQRALAFTLFILGAVSTCALLTQIPFSSWRWALTLTVLTVCALVTWRHWRQNEQAKLTWDGQSWRLLGDVETLGQVQVRLDWQVGMLLTFEVTGEPLRWLWLSQASSSTQRWRDVRRAVWAPRSERPHAGATGGNGEFSGSWP